MRRSLGMLGRLGMFGALGVLGVLAACKARPEPAAVPTARCAVRIEFEPPLLVPGEVHFAHECGATGVVATSCTGVELQLPPGPVVVTLAPPGRRQPLALRVAPGLEPVVWNEAR